MCVINIIIVIKTNTSLIIIDTIINFAIKNNVINSFNSFKIKPFKKDFINFLISFIVIFNEIFLNSLFQYWFDYYCSNFIVLIQFLIRFRKYLCIYYY